MFGSILKDAQFYFRNGNMITRIILVNCCVFIGVVLLKVFTGGWATGNGSTVYDLIVRDNLAISCYTSELIRHPWTLFTHMFLHEGLWHFVWNMLLLFWFGRIAGDLLGDKKMIPLYVLGGLVGAFFFVLASNFISGVSMGYALGASAAVMSIIMATGLTAPEYNLRLIIIGNVSLKYIVLAILVIDFLGMASGNAGSSIGHLGGALFGGLYVYGLRQGYNLGAPVDYIQDMINGTSKKLPINKNMHVAHRSTLIGDKKESQKKSRLSSEQDTIDGILDKIKQEGFDSLSEEEKDFLYQASKK